MQYTIENMDVVAQKFTFSYSDFADEAATSKTFDLPVRGDDVYLLGVMGRVNTAFVTGTAPQVKLGFPTLDDYFIPLQRLNVVGPLKTGWRGQLFCEGMAHATAKNQRIQLTVQNTTGNLSAYTAGEFEIVLIYVADKL